MSKNTAYRTVSIPAELYKTIENLIKQEKLFSSIADFVKQSCRNELKQYREENKNE